MTVKTKPAPLEAGLGKQMDDNIDDLAAGGTAPNRSSPARPLTMKTPLQRNDRARARRSRAQDDGTKVSESVPKTGDDIPPNLSIVPSNPD